jgi:hypothetical protein
MVGAFGRLRIACKLAGELSSRLDAAQWRTGFNWKPRRVDQLQFLADPGAPFGS